MLRSLRYPVALIVVALAFFGGAATATMRIWFDPVVRITISNDTGQPITAMRIQVRTDDSTHLALIDSLPAAGQHRLYIHTSDRATLAVEARLQDGREIHSSDSYLEPGVSLTSHVEAARVRIEYLARL